MRLLYDDRAEHAAALVVRAEIAIRAGRVEGMDVDVARRNIARSECLDARRQRRVGCFHRRLRIEADGMGDWRSVAPFDQLTGFDGYRCRRKAFETHVDDGGRARVRGAVRGAAGATAGQGENQSQRHNQSPLDRYRHANHVSRRAAGRQITNVRSDRDR